jgi:hypothetical protein
MRDCFEFAGKSCGYHEKHRAWVIMRENVSLTGGSWFESFHAKTKEELISYLSEKYGSKLSNALKQV